jgi:hypothetical protein
MLICRRDALRRMKNLRFTKVPRLAHKVVFIDGIAHSGKLLLGPILSSYRRVEIHRLDTIFEHIAVLEHFGEVTRRGAATMMRFALDEYLYNNMIGRGINVRPTDESSIFSGLNQDRYFKRLSDATEGEAIVRRIAKEKPVYQALTHDILGFAEPCFDAFDPDFFILEMVRHPLNIAERWLNWGWGRNRYAEDPRSFIMTFESGGKALPYFARDRKASYWAGKAGDKVIGDILSVWRQMFACYGRLSAARRRRVLWIKFESFVRDPYPDLARLESLLGLKRGPKLAAVLKQQRCPRVLPPDDHARLRELIRRQASPAALRKLDALCTEYEAFDPVRPAADPTS